MSIAKLAEAQAYSVDGRVSSKKGESRNISSGLKGQPSGVGEIS